MTEKDRTKFLLNKGQEISEGNCGVLNSSKKTPMKPVSQMGQMNKNKGIFCIKYSLL